MAGSVCQICGTSSNSCNCQRAMYNLNVGERLKIKRDGQGNVIEVSREKTPDCWVVTAYYGDPLNPNVCAIRAMRNQLVVESPAGSLISLINIQYKKLGTSRVGIWWAAKVSEKNHNLPRVITSYLCWGLLRLAKKTT